MSGRTMVLWVAPLIALVLGVGAAMVLLGPRSVDPPTLLHATQIPPRLVADFELVDQHGAPFGPERMRGRWSLLFFGYTHCPDVCPATMHVLDGAVKEIHALADPAPDTQVVFVSVDPRRDTPQQLAQYVPYFNKDFLGVTGSTEAINRLTSQLGILHMRSGGDPEGGGYLVDHSASILLFDPQGRQYAVFGPPHDAPQIARDFLALARYYEVTR